jgi:endoglucanase Acf2
MQASGGSSKNGVSQAKVATILFAGKAATFNWFDPDLLTRHAIQWMPFSAVSDALLPTAWLRESLPLVQARTSMPMDR